MVGQIVGKYRLVRKLGEGGMGTVFEAEHVEIGGRAALKLLRTEMASRPEQAARFFNEARAANLVVHPGIVRIFDYGNLPDGQAFITMEFLEGESLYARMQRLKTFTQPETVRLGKQIADALAAAHAKQVIHRDLKPENIMIVAEPEAPAGERVKVLDFGIAKILREMRGVALTQVREVMGTPIYMPPELFRDSKGATDRTDVYALGVILYEMLAGRPPFDAEDAMAMMGMHLFKEPPSLQQCAKGVQAPLAGLIHAMLAKDVQQRPAMSQVAQELQRMGRTSSDMHAVASPPLVGVPPSEDGTVRMDKEAVQALLAPASEQATGRVRLQMRLAHLKTRILRSKYGRVIAGLIAVLLCVSVFLIARTLSRKPDVRPAVAPVASASSDKTAADAGAGPEPPPVAPPETAEVVNENSGARNDARKTAKKNRQNTARALSSDDVSLLLSRAINMARLQNFPEALKDAKRVADMTDDAYSWTLVGRYACQLRQPEKADDALARIKKQGSKQSSHIALLLSECAKRGYVLGPKKRFVLKKE